MSAQKKISRRKLMYGGIGAAAAIAAGSLAAYYAMGPPAPVTRTTTTAPRKGATINVLSIQDPFYFPLEKLVKNFEEEHGIKVNLQAVAYDELHAKLVNSFLSKSSGIDVVSIDNMWIGQYADNGWVIPLDEYIQRDKKEVNVMDFIPSVIYNLCEWRGRILSLPVAPYAQGVMYRVDVFDELGLEHPPTDVDKSADWTWDKYYDLVKKINGKTVGGTRFYGTVICGAQPAPIVHMYTQLAASNGVKWFKSFPGAPWDFETLINSPENVKSLELYIKLYKESPPESINYLWFDAGLQFGMKGNVGIMFWWSPYFYLVTKAGYEVKEDSILGINGKPNYDKYRGALLPRNPAYPQVHSVSAWTFGIPTYSANKEEAWEFIKWATSAKTQKEMGLSLEPSPYQFSDFARKSLYEDKQLQEIYPWLPLQLKLFEGWESPYKCIPSGKIVRPGMPLYVTLEGVYGLYLNKALAGGMSPSEALDTANSFMKTLLERNFYIPWKAESYNDTLENSIELMKRLS